MECYCTCIIEILSYFFILQSLTASKMRQFQPLKLSQFHKAKTCWTENSWSSGIMSSFWGEFFYVLVGKIFFLIFFKKYCSVRTKKLHKMKLKIFFWILGKKIMIFKPELSPQNFHYDVLYSYTRIEPKCPTVSMAPSTWPPTVSDSGT